MADLTDLPEGRWGLSRIVETSPRAFTVAAVVQKLGECRIHYPPLNTTKTAYTFPFAVVHFPFGVTGTPDADTRLVPNRLLNTALGDLTTVQRNALRNNLEEWLTGYSYIDWDNTQQAKAAFSAAGYDGTTLLKRVLLDVCRHLGHTSYRPRPAVFESHNTEYTDNFGSDPSSNWTGIMGSAPTWDSGNSEYDANTDNIDAIHAYSANNPGSIEQEAQITALQAGTASADGFGTAIRVDRTAQDGYVFQPSRQNATHWVVRYNGATRSTVATLGTLSLSTNVFITERAAASGGVGSNVVLSLWMTDHGGTKPSDPGWIGADGSPDQTYTDTSADRLDASTHIECGFGWTGTSADWDTRCCFFKERAISDRSGGSTAAASSSGAATATASSSSTTAVPANSAGTATATAASATTATADLNASGSAAATGAAASIASADASSAGVSTATAVGESAAEGAGAGSAAGTSTATAAGAATATTDAYAAGASTATARTSYTGGEVAGHSHSPKGRSQAAKARKRQQALLIKRREDQDNDDILVISAAVQAYLKQIYIDAA